MKIATYNIWNSTLGMPEREHQIIYGVFVDLQMP